MFTRNFAATNTINTTNLFFFFSCFILCHIDCIHLLWHFVCLFNGQPIVGTRKRKCYRNCQSRRLKWVAECEIGCVRFSIASWSYGMVYRNFFQATICETVKSHMRTDQKNMMMIVPCLFLLYFFGNVLAKEQLTGRYERVTFIFAENGAGSW